MVNGNREVGRILVMVIMTFSTIAGAHPINDYYKKYKNDIGMEARTIPPKMASLFIDEDYPEAIDILKSMSALKYLNFEGDHNKVKKYAQKAISAKGDYEKLLDQNDKRRHISVFGFKKKGMVRKLIAVVESKSQFVLLIGKGKLTKKQIALFPDLAKEI